MSQSESTEDLRRYELYLAQPSLLPELDIWVEERIKSQWRFTFSERDILQEFWHAGEDMRLREDKRFEQVILSHPMPEVQWKLKKHIVTNQYLYEVLEHEAWDGQNLDHYLEQLDRGQSSDAFHIFCVHDPSFLVSYNEQGICHISLRVDGRKRPLTGEQKTCLDQLAEKILALCSDTCRTPLSTYKMLEHIKCLSAPSEILAEISPGALETWLLQREEWLRVGQDLWFPKQLVPSLAKGHRYAVQPIYSQMKEQSGTLSYIASVSPAVQEENQATTTAAPSPDRYLSQLSMDASIKWRMILRTVHINEGYLPVPPKACELYPRAKKLARLVAIPSIWFTDACEMTVWLDTEKHQLYGPDLLDKLAFVGAGTVLEILWTAAGITFHPIGLDSQVAEEEVRLVDLTELAQVRSTLLESYRRSLRAIMAISQTGWTFLELYNELCARQQHKPNRSTVRCILSSSPEFTFLREEKKWKLHIDVTPEFGARVLRKARLFAQEGTFADGVSAMSITESLAKSRERLAHLRSLYLDAGHSSH